MNSIPLAAVRKIAPALDPAFLANFGQLIIWGISFIVLGVLVFSTIRLRRYSRIFRRILLESAKMTTLHQILMDAKANDDRETVIQCEVEHVRCALEINRLWGLLGINTHQMRDAIEGMKETQEGTDGIS